MEFRVVCVFHFYYNDFTFRFLMATSFLFIIKVLYFLNGISSNDTLNVGVFEVMNVVVGCLTGTGNIYTCPCWVLSYNFFSLYVSTCVLDILPMVSFVIFPKKFITCEWVISFVLNSASSFKRTSGDKSLLLKWTNFFANTDVLLLVMRKFLHVVIIHVDKKTKLAINFVWSFYSNKVSRIIHHSSISSFQAKPVKAKHEYIQSLSLSWLHTWRSWNLMLL